MKRYELYGDWLSQPSRAVWALATIENANMGAWDLKYINLGKGEHLTPENKKINPIGRVPFMRVVTPGHPDKNLSESYVILKYLCWEQNLPDHWYPKNDLD